MCSGQEGLPVIREAGAPYADTDADIILRSSDGVDFRVHRLFLSKASPIFADMFTLPSPRDAPTGDKRKDELPVVEMSENESSLRLLLEYCYPALSPPELADIDIAERAYRVADKFQLSRARTLASDKLKEFAKGSPERVYTFGWNFRLPDLVRAAALESLYKPYNVEMPAVQDCVGLEAVALLNLFDYQRTCIKAAQDVLNLSWYEASMLNLDRKETNQRLDKSSAPIILHHSECSTKQSPCPASLGKSRSIPSYRQPHKTPLMHFFPPLRNYLEKLHSALKDCPRASTLLSEKATRSAIAKIAKDVKSCDECREGTIVLILALGELLASKVEMAVAEVSANIVVCVLNIELRISIQVSLKTPF